MNHQAFIFIDGFTAGLAVCSLMWWARIGMPYMPKVAVGMSIAGLVGAISAFVGMGGWWA